MKSILKNQNSLKQQDILEESQEDSKVRRPLVSRVKPKKFLGRYIDVKNVNLLPSLLVLSICLGLFNSCVDLMTLVSVSQVATKPPPRMVERPDGSTVSMVPVLNNVPTPQAAQYAAYMKLLALNNWDGFTRSVQPEDFGKPIQDAGVPIPVGQGQQLKISTNCWKMSWSLTEPFRSQYLIKRAQGFPQDVFNSGNGLRVVFHPVPQEDRSPVEILPNKQYKVRVSGLLYWFEDGNNLARSTTFQQDVYLKEVISIDPVVLKPSSEKAAKEQQTLTRQQALHQIVYESTKDGFMITNIVDQSDT